MSPTKEQWESISNKLHYGYGIVELLIDGERIELFVATRRRNPLVRGLFVNVRNANRETHSKFLRKTTIHHLSKKQIRECGYRRKEIDREYEGEQNARTLFSHEWPSFNALKRHLIANCSSIELYVDPPSRATEEKE